MQAIHSTASVGAGARRFSDSARAVSEDALKRFALLAGIVLASLVAPLWGYVLSLSALSKARRRLQSEGLIGLGELLAPEISRAQYADGVWRGLWRVHGTSLAFWLIQLPTVLLALAPAALTWALLQPLRFVFPGDLGPSIASGATALVAFFCVLVIAAQTVLALRILSESGQKLSLGYIARICGEAWRATLRDLNTVLGIGLAVVGAIVTAAVVIVASYYLATGLKLSGGIPMVVLWTAAAANLFLLATVLDAIVAWADGTKTTELNAKTFSFSAWLKAWFGSMYTWFAAKGLATVGLAVCLVAGALTAAVAVLSGRNFESWVGLGWFAVSAAVLVAVSFKRSVKS